MKRRLFAASVAACLALVSAGPKALSEGLELVSVSTAGEPGSSSSGRPAISADGRFVAFTSYSGNLVDGDTNERLDVFLRDRHLGITTRLSTSSEGAEGNGVSYDPGISGDGRYVLFSSSSSNLVANDTNNAEDVFLHDRLTGNTLRVSLSITGAQLPRDSRGASISSNGRFVAIPLVPAFGGSSQVLVYDRDTDGDGLFDEPGATARSVLNQGNPGLPTPFSIFEPDISADGRYVTFLMRGWGTANIATFHDRDLDEDGVFDETGGVRTMLLSGVAADAQHPAITPDGRYTVFNGTAALVAGDTNQRHDVFVFDRQTETITRVSVDSNGGEGAADATLVGSVRAEISADGRLVTFVSYSPTLVPGDTNERGDLFLHDRDADGDGIFDEPGAIETRRLNETVDGVEPPGEIDTHDISADGNYVAFDTHAGLVSDDSNNNGFDVYLVAVNRSPRVSSITAAPALVAVTTAVTAGAAFTDADGGDRHTAVWSWGDGTTSAATVIDAGRGGSASGTHTYSAPGVYAVTLTVSDGDGAIASARYEYVVVYDPTAGFVTGNGQIDSPAGAFRPDPSLAGPARVSFVSRYQKGTNAPTGNTQFDFKLAGLSFSSDEYAWLVVSGARAQFKGTGRVNGVPGYAFLLTAIDGNLPGGGGLDAVRVKIWEAANGTIVYDNHLGAGDDAAVATEVRNGSVVIHK